MKKIIITLAVLGLMVAPSMAAISYIGGDSIGEVVTSTNGTQTLSTFAGGVGNYVVVSVAIKVQNHSGETPIAGVTYGGSAMTLIGSMHADDATWDAFTYLYGITSAAISGDVVTTLELDNGADGSSFDGMSTIATSWAGVDSVGVVSAGSTKFGSVTGDSFSDTIVGTSADSLVLSSWVLGAPSSAMSSIDSTMVINNIASGYNTGALQSQAGGGDITSTLTWTDANSRRAAGLSMELVAAVPEPATVGMLGLGALVALLIRRIRA